MTPNPDTDLSEILRRVEAATDQDRELDVAIHEALCERMYETIIKRGGDYCLRYYPGPPEPEYYKLPRYTASLDAAISLVERLDLKWWILRRGHVTAYHCEIRVYNGGAEYQAFHGQSRTAPLAVLSALFHALLERTKHAYAFHPEPEGAAPEDRGEKPDIRCRFHNHAPAVGIYWVPQGCICWPDPIQALCMQHFISAESNGPIVRIVDLTEAANPLPSDEVDGVVERLNMTLVQEARQYGPTDWHNVPTDLGKIAAFLIQTLRAENRQLGSQIDSRDEMIGELKTENERLRKLLKMESKPNE